MCFDITWGQLFLLVSLAECVLCVCGVKTRKRACNFADNLFWIDPSIFALGVWRGDTGAKERKKETEKKREKNVIWVWICSRDLWELWVRTFFFSSFSFEHLTLDTFCRLDQHLISGVCLHPRVPPLYFVICFWVLHSFVLPSERTACLECLLSVLFWFTALWVVSPFSWWPSISWPFSVLFTPPTHFFFFVWTATTKLSLHSWAHVPTICPDYPACSPLHGSIKKKDIRWEHQ